VLDGTNSSIPVSITIIEIIGLQDVSALEIARLFSDDVINTVQPDVR